MQQEIDDRLATELLAGEIHDGDTVLVDLAPEGDRLTVAPAASVPAGVVDDEEPEDLEQGL
jgi:ATP-dependent Clp protease ATP-binding subunit ClpB